MRPLDSEYPPPPNTTPVTSPHLEQTIPRYLRRYPVQGPLHQPVSHRPTPTQHRSISSNSHPLLINGCTVHRLNVPLEVRISKQKTGFYFSYNEIKFEEMSKMKQSEDSSQFAGKCSKLAAFSRGVERGKTLTKPFVVRLFGYLNNL